MTFVLYALAPVIAMSFYNTGYMAYHYEGVDPTIAQSLARGAMAMIPLIITSYAAGGLAELVFCIVRKHEINEGFLVTAMLYPLTLPASTPLWMAAIGIIFGVVIGKEIFGGVGYNVWNPALVARAFVFFTYPAAVSGTGVWDLSDPEQRIDGYTGATPLLAVKSGAPGEDPVALLLRENWTWNELFLGTIPGSSGETSTLAALLGAAFLLFVGIASWRVMFGTVIGAVATAALFNAVAAGNPELGPMWSLQPHYHLVMGGFAFGAVFMATDPVSSATTNLGRWLFGLGIGAMCVMVRTVNPAYPEAMMLSILFMNTFAPLLDYFVLQASSRARVARMAGA
jgi:Na+-transporting NADH:ubiquinone oxidoreductase subunit B